MTPDRLKLLNELLLELAEKAEPATSQAALFLAMTLRGGLSIHPPGRNLLEAAIRCTVEDTGWTFINFHRVGTHGGSVSFCKSDVYVALSATVDPLLQDRKEIDAAIFEELKKQIEA